MHEKFIEILRTKYGELSESETEFLKRNSIIKSYRKNEIIFFAGNIQRYTYFILDGYARLFYNLQGKDKTGFFYNKGSFIWPESNQKITQRNYSCIVNSTIVLINNNHIKELVERSSNFAHIYKLSKEEELNNYHKLISCFVTLSPEERFRNLIKKNSSIFLNVPQQYIASFIGVSAESFSRIKKRIYQNPLCG
ncbi:MAG: Crp/Fnr family transcriptional regulator [Marinilabiliales bacterium]|nr:MAG: Crp/Fnr family transcriptional regulator [Marinilabiliales bacterium]